MPGWLRSTVSYVVVIGVLALSAGASGRRLGADARSTRPDPVVLVHGYGATAHSWDPFVEHLVAGGHPRDEIVVLDYDSAQSNVTTARQLAAAVADLRMRTGARRVDLVSHSMGALSSRWFVQELGGRSQVDAWVSIGGADRGTWYGLQCPTRVSCRELLPGSEFQRRLGPTVDRSGRTRFGAWWSPCDRIIEPRRNARLIGADNVETRCIAHISLLFDPAVADQVAAFIDRRRSARHPAVDEQVFGGMLGR